MFMLCFHFEQVFVALQFLAQGSYQKCVVQNLLHPMSQSSASRCIIEVVPQIVMVLGYLVKFPSTDVERSIEKEL